MAELLHRLVMELFLDEPLRPDQCIYHKDGNKLHNCPCNLAIQSCACHAWHHKRTRPLIAYCRF